VQLSGENEEDLLTESKSAILVSRVHSRLERDLQVKWGPVGDIAMVAHVSDRHRYVSFQEEGTKEDLLPISASLCFSEGY
jgi:hypothetical protein